MTGRHHLHVPIPAMPSNLFGPAPVWPKDEHLADAELRHEPTKVFGPVSLPEQERAEHSERVAELAEEIRRTPRWLLVRLALGVALFVVAIAVVLVLAGCTTTAGTPVPVSTSLMQPEPEEDEPGFDCHTMRNRVCGPTEVKA